MTKTFLIAVFLGLLVATPGVAAEPVTNNATLNVLSSTFTNRTYLIGTNQHVVTLMWMSKIHASRCQRPLTLYLKTTEVGGFVNPTMKPFPMGDWPALMNAIKDDLKEFLKQKDIREDDIMINPGYGVYGLQ